MTQPVLTFEQQKNFWKMMRELAEASADVAVQHVRKDEKGHARAVDRHTKAQTALGAFVESITEKPTRVTG